MIDTIHIELLDVAIPKLKDHQTTVHNDTGEIRNEVGYINSIKVKKHRGIIRIECSLPKLLKGNNVHMLSYPDILAALRKIEQELAIPISKGVIRRMDIYINIETDYAPSSYYRYLGDTKYLTRVPVGKTSLYYKNQTRQMYFYDKILEMKMGRQEMPEDIKHLMRIEYRLINKGLKNLFKGELCVRDLYDENIATKLIKELHGTYKSIFKDAKLASESITFIDSYKSFVEQLASKGIEAYGGINSVIEMIEVGKSSERCPLVPV